MNSRRIAKAQESFKREISNIIFSMKDARLHKKLVTVTSVELSNDCLFCKAYISSVDGFKHSKIICKILNHAANYIQMTLAINLKTRFMPKVLFIPSDSEEYAFKINNILSKSNKSTLFEISEFLQKNNNFAIFTHVIPDGDAISSCGALYLALKQIGKNAKVIFDKEIPERLKFLLNYFDNKDKFEPENFICLDVSDKKRIFGIDTQNFNICIDHHDVESCDFTNMFYLNKKASSCAEIIYDLLSKMNIHIDKKIATLIYVGICSDTGGFKYSNTNSNLFGIMYEIFDKIENFSDLNYKLSGNFTREFIKFKSEIVNNFEYYDNVCVSFITIDIMKKFNIKYSDLNDSIYQIPLQIEGVELAVIIKQKEENLFKISARSKNNGKALEFCKIFGGGGHPNAAGFELIGNLNYVKDKVFNFGISKILCRDDFTPMHF